MSEAKQRSVITDKVVLPATGATMEDWFRHLDSFGAQKLTSSEIYKLIASIDGLAPLGEWDQGLLSTSYQWSRGLRGRGEKKDGFEISLSKTIGVPITNLYRSLVDEERRTGWLPEPIEVTKQTPDRSVRAVWGDGETRLSVDVYSKGEFKSQVVVQHLKLTDSAAAERMKIFWGEKLNKLKGLLEA
ncbi:MAG TPA: hypothetical protein VGO43_08305 [Pyrinomonadaceae bacterium]|nr:hypothetical protein [Pyrinomonadaceae bacterium]